MKRVITALAVVLLALFCIQPVYATNVSADTVPADTEASVYSVTVKYNSNKGTGVMADQTVSSSGTAVKLSANTFSRKGYTFTGWNTKANGKGTAYTDQADVTSLADEETNGTTITLYAQWKINAPKIKKVTSTVPGKMKISYSKVAQAGSYEIQYSTSKKFKKATKAAAKKGTSSIEITDCVPNKVYYVRMRSYDKSTKKYSDWSNVKSKKIKKGYTIMNTKSHFAVEADITLKGSGTGYHAKLVICAPLSAVSFGIQYDAHAVAPYTGKAMALIENVAHNGPGGQTYTRPGNKSLKVGKSYHMMITMDKKGKGAVYLDYKKIGSFKNSSMVGQQWYIRTEGSARLNGDSVNATFKNIRLKTGNGVVNKGKERATWVPRSCPSIKTKAKSSGDVTISGHVSGINGDWDSDYENVSGIRQYY